MNKSIVLFLISIFLSACEKEINIDLKNAIPQLVIEGNVSDSPGPHTVKLSKTVNFSSPNIFPTVSGALVVISDNTGIRDTLSEITPGLYQTHVIIGTPGNTYNLFVETEGKQYFASSTMPQNVSLDSIQFDLFDDPGETEVTYAVVPVFLDPLPFGDNYRFFFAANGVADKTYQVTNDNIGNGKVNKQPFRSDNLKFHKGDTVEVTMLRIDVNTYNYFYTLSQLSDSGPGGGAAPSNPPNNFTGNKALGIFSAYTTQTKQAIAQ